MFITKERFNDQGKKIYEFILNENVTLKNGVQFLDGIATKMHFYWKDNRNNIYRIRSTKKERVGGTAT
jgi:hypothetical protein